MRKFVFNLLAIALLLPSLTLLAQTRGTDVIRYGDVRHPLRDREGMVVSANILASEVGARVLADGGTAVDAAVAVGFALAVVRPRAGNIGGGGNCVGRIFISWVVTIPAGAFLAIIFFYVFKATLP